MIFNVIAKSKLVRSLLIVWACLVFYVYTPFAFSGKNKSILLFDNPISYSSNYDIYITGKIQQNQKSDKLSNKPLFYDEDFVQYKFNSYLLSKELYTNHGNKSCHIPKQSSSLLVSRDSLELNSNLKFYRDKLLQTKYKTVIKDNLSLREDEVLSKKWFLFGGNSVYLPDHGIHLMASRIIYSSVGEKDKPKISFISIKAYDLNFREIKGSFTFKYINYSFNIQSKPSFIRKDAAITLNFPNIVNIQFDHNIDKAFLGPEDPKLFLNKFGHPMVTFNMFDNKINSRRIYAFHIFENTLRQLRIKNKLLLGTEKNWLPFCEPTFSSDSTIKSDEFYLSNSIRFIYSFEPLLVVECNFEDGLCDIINSSEEKLDESHASFIKGTYHEKGKPQFNKLKKRLGGGSSLFQVPNNIIDQLPISFQTYKFWVLFSRTHLKKCGCGKTFYRPNIVLLSEFNNVFQILSVSFSLSFNMVVKSYKGETYESCSGKKSVLLVNGISKWESRMNGQEDLLTIQLSQADLSTEMIEIKNFGNYILQILQKTLVENKVGGIAEGSSNRALKQVNTRLVECVLQQAEKYCKDYSQKHSQ